MLAAFLPIWFLVVCGYVVARLGLLGEEASRVLTGFAFYIAMPAVLFTNLAGAELDRIPLRALVSLATGTILVGLAGLAAARWLLRDRPAGQIMTGMAAAYLNSGNLGIPMALSVLGDTLLIAAVMIFQTAVVTPVFLLSMDATTLARNGGRRVVLWLAPLRNPIVLASLSGLALNASGVELPSLALRPLEALGSSAVPVALVALGMTLRMPSGSRPRGHWGQVAAVSALKTVAHPLLAYLVARFFFGVEGQALFAVALLAALPAAQLVFVYADRYRTKVDISRDVVVVSSLASIPVLSVIALAFS